MGLCEFGRHRLSPKLSNTKNALSMQSMEACAIDMPGSVSPVASRELGISLGEL
jgi:hypothetical protein